MLCVRGRWSDRLVAEIRAGAKTVLPRCLHRPCSLRTEWLGHGLHALQRRRCCSYPYAPKTGAPSQLLKIKGYRDHFSWLLLNQDVKRSFASIWQSLNQRQERVPQESAYARWQFDFMAPPSLVGTTMDVRGPFDPESNELLVWEIEKLQGLRFSHRGDIFSTILLSSYPSGR